MIINIANHECTELWDGIFYKALSNFPEISEWEMKNIIDFINYEKLNGRETKIVSDKDDILQYVKRKITNGDKYKNVSKPDKITECTACRQNGCLTRFLCHTAPIENAIKIFECEKLLSAVKARKMPAEKLKREPRNAANDPIDFFDYVMFSWGNCQAGDRLVMERKMNRLPTEEDLSIYFTPGIRFYFDYDCLDKHPNAIHDGFLPLKVKHEIRLDEYVYAIIIPQDYKEQIENIVPKYLRNKVYYLENDCRDIWEWSEKVFNFVDDL